MVQLVPHLHYNLSLSQEEQHVLVCARVLVCACVPVCITVLVMVGSRLGKRKGTRW